MRKDPDYERQGCIWMSALVAFLTAIILLTVRREMVIQEATAEAKAYEEKARLEALQRKTEKGGKHARPNHSHR